MYINISSQSIIHNHFINKCKFKEVENGLHKARKS